jgi:hypothetical protein
MLKEELAKTYSLFTFGRAPGLGRMFSPDMHEEVYRHLSGLDGTPISKVQLNQLFVISQAASVSDGYFRYYWRDVPDHTYDLRALEISFKNLWVNGSDQQIVSHDHFKWGLYRAFIDGLLYFGNVEAGFNYLRSLTFEELSEFFSRKRFDTKAISARGPALGLQDIAKDDRYLISEMACKTFGEVPDDAKQARAMLQEGLRKHIAAGGGAIKFRKLLENVSQQSNREQLLLSFDDVLDHDITGDGDLLAGFDGVLNKFLAAREKAIANTSLYLSMVNDLDVYVATSMRNRENFRAMAAACEQIFNDKRLSHLHLRYFDPTKSAAKGHEDKGLIECLMVKCAKVLVYCEGEKESYGKDAEAAMALSLGKPVIFFCDQGKKTNFYRDVHPLSRLIDFRSGVAVGAIVTADVGQVAELLLRIVENKMQYRIEHHSKRPGYLKLIDKLTDSVVRLQTDNELLEATFWNNYHNRRKHFISLAAGKEAERLQE